MPVTPPVIAAPYDTAETVLQMARAKINDMAQTADGNLLSDFQPYSFFYLNLGWRRLQRKLANKGWDGVVKEATLLNVTPIAVTDPGTQVYINWVQYFDGLNNQTSPVLPQDLIIPLRLWERQNGTVFNFRPMQPVNDGLPSRAQSSWLGFWQWRQDAIYMIGANQANDIRMEYASFLADIPAPQQGQIATTPIPIMRCGDPLACYTAYEFAHARGAPQSAELLADGDQLVDQIGVSIARLKQRGSHRRIPYGQRRRSAF